MKMECLGCNEKKRSLSKEGLCVKCHKEKYGYWPENFTDKSEKGMKNNKPLKDAGKIK